MKTLLHRKDTDYKIAALRLSPPGRHERQCGVKRHNERLQTGMLAIVVLLLCGTIPATVLPAAQAKPEKSTVHIGYASQSGAFAQLWIAAQKGYFNAEGLNAEILFTRTVTGVQAMMSGEVDFVATGCPELFRAKRQGFDLRVIGDFAPVNVYLI